MLARSIFIALLGYGVSVQAQSIVAGEYWVDSDPGWGQGISINGIPEQEDVDGYSFSLPIGFLPLGIHTIGYRTKDAQGHWSHTNHNTLLVVAPEQQSPIARTVYFLNTDPGWDGGTDAGVEGAFDVLEATVADVSAATLGMNILYFRSQDLNGRWSHTNHMTLLVADSSHRVVVAAESFWDVDPGFGQGDLVVDPQGLLPGADVSSTQFQVVVPDTLEANTYHQLYLRALDSHGHWSLTNWQVDSIYVDFSDDVNDVSVQTGISTWPNPFTTGITVHTNDGRPVRVVLYDPQGKLVHDRVLVGETFIDLEGQAPGAYTAFFWKEKERIHRVTLIKQ